MKTLGFVLIALAGIVFYVAFFVLAPAIAATIPQGEWHDFFVMFVYVLIAILGGSELPIFLLVIGMMFWYE